MSRDRGVSKEAKDLAARVNALDGYTAELVRGGAHSGRAYVVRRRGEFVARFSGHASYGSLALVRAEAELRRLEVPLPRKDVTKKKEALMPAPTLEEKRLSDQLRPRVAAVLDGMGGDTTENRTRLAKRAAEIVGRNGGENFGGAGAASEPHLIAAASLKKFLEGGALKMVNLERWRSVADELVRQAGENGNGATPEPARTPPADVYPGTDDQATDDSGAALRDERERRELAESLLEDAERERDEAKSLAEARESARASLVQQVEDERRRAVEARERLSEEVEALSFQRGRADKLEKEVERAKKDLEKAKAEPPDSERKHEAVIRGYKGRISTEQKRREQAEQAAAEAERRADESVRLADSANVGLGQAEERINALDRQREELAAQLERLERQVASPAAQARDFLFAELEAAQGAPRPWLLERLDRMLGDG